MRETEKRTKAVFLTALFVCYLIFNGILLWGHELWRDEANVWLLARELSPFELLREIKYQGHPCLWYFLAMPFAKLGLPFFNPLMNNGFNNNLYKKRRCKRPAALLVSQYADSRRINRWIGELKSMKSDICLITANQDSPNINRVHYAVIVDSEEAVTGKLGNFASRTKLSYVLDMLYMILFMKDYEENLENMKSWTRERERPEW